MRGTEAVAEVAAPEAPMLSGGESSAPPASAIEMPSASEFASAALPSQPETVDRHAADEHAPPQENHPTPPSSSAYVVEELGTLPSAINHQWDSEPVAASELSDLEAAPESWFDKKYHAAPITPASTEVPAPASAGHDREREIESLFAAPPNAESHAPEPDHITESPAPSANQSPLPDPMVGRTPVFTDAIRATPTPFATETLAALYLQQGFRDEALVIYQQLLERNPSDDSLRARYLAVQSGETSDVLAAASPSTPPSTNKKAAQSVRTFFGHLARRAPRRSAAIQSLEAPAAPVSSSLTQLFAGESGSSSDAAAANSLASAYSSDFDERGTSGGGPARSLDHLFQSAPGGAVTLDEFYSSPDAAGSPGSGSPQPKDERQAEIKEFTAWLEGLKKK
jgi:hypothetical protein